MSSWTPAKGGAESIRRRSQRVILSLPVTVRTENAPRDSSFEEATQSLVVNAHGALITLAAKVEKGQTLRLTNRATRDERQCVVMYIGPASDGKAQVGVEFTSPSPDFWRIVFPPEDWTMPEHTPAHNRGKKS